MERAVTDAKGSRWDVSDGGAREEDGAYRLRFRHASGREYDVSSRLAVNELSDRQLLDMVEAERSAER